MQRVPCSVRQSFRSPAATARRNKLAPAMLAGVAGVMANWGPGAAEAADGTWIGNTASVAQNWSDTTKWQGGTIASDAGAIARFDTLNIGGSRNVTVDTSFAIGQLLIGDISGGQVFTVTGPGSLIFNNNGAGASLTQQSASGANVFSAPIVLADALTITNNSAVLLSVNGGTTSVNGSHDLVLKADGDGGITFGAAGTIDHSGTITNSGGGAGLVTLTSALGPNVTAVIQNGVSTLLLNGANGSYAGPLTVASGTLQSTVAGLGTGTVYLGATTGVANATFVNSGLAVFNNSIIVQAGGTTSALSSSATSTSTATYAGTVTLNHDLTLSAGAAGIVVSGGIIGTGSGFAIINSGGGSGTSSISGAIGTGVTNLTQNSTTSSLSLTGTNTDFTGTVDVLAGTLTLSGPNSLSNANAVNIASGATLSVGNASTVYTIGALTGAGSVAKVSGNTRTLTFGGASGTSTFSGVISTPSGTFNIVKAGAGTQVFDNVNTFAGILSVAAGTLRLSGSGTLGATTNTLNVVNGTLDIGDSSQTQGSVIVSGTGTIQGSVGTSLTGTSYSITNPSGMATIGVNLLGGATVTMSKSGAGLAVLNGTNTYQGGTTISGGTLSLGSADAIGTTGTISFTGGGVLQFTAANTTDYSARFSNAVSQTYGIDTNRVTISLGTALTSSSGTLTKHGTGTLNLNAANTYNSGTSVFEGTLKLGVADAIAQSTAISVGGGAVVGAIATFDLNGFNQSISTFNLGGGAAGSTANVLIRGGTVILAGSGNVNYLGNTNNANGATISATAGGAIHLNITQSKTFIVGDSTATTEELTIDVPLQNGAGFSGGLAKTGAGTLVLGAANTFAGNLSVGSTTSVGGTLKFASTGSTLSTMQWNVINGTVDLNGTTQSVTASGSSINLGGGAAGTGASSTINIGTGTLNLLSTGGFNYSNSNDNLGATINAATGGKVVIHGNTTWTVGDSSVVDDLTVNAKIEENGGSRIITKSGAGTLVLTASNLFSGGMSNNGGTIAIGTNDAMGLGSYRMIATSGIRSSNTTDRVIDNVVGTFAGTNATYSFGDFNAVATGNLTFSSTTTSSLGASAAARTFAVHNTTSFAGGFSGGGSSITKTGSGTLILNGTSTYSGGTTVSAGTLLVNNTGVGSGLGSGGVVVSGGTLGGSGRIGAAVTISSGGTIAAGNNAVGTLAAGSLTLSGAMRAQVSTSSDVSDKLSVTGTVDVTGAMLELDLGSLHGNYSPPPFVLIENDGDLIANGADVITGSFAGLTRGGPNDSAAYDDGALKFTLYYGYDAASSSLVGGNDLAIAFQSVPEPASLSIVGFGLGGLLTRRRRRRQSVA